MTHVHNFDTQLAKQYGVNQAILLEYFRFWITLNRNNNKNHHEGKTWLYNTVQSIHEVYSYFTYKQVRYAIGVLIKKGVLVKNKFNRCAWDKTCWYAFADEELFINSPVCAGDPQAFGKEHPDPGWQQKIPFPMTVSPQGQLELPYEANGTATKGQTLPVVLEQVHKKGEGSDAAPTVFFEKKERRKEDENCAAREKRSATRKSRPLKERRAFLINLIRKVNTKREEMHQKPWPRKFLNDFVRYWTQPNFDETELKYEGMEYFGVAWHLESFWKKTTPDERYAYAMQD